PLAGDDRTFLLAEATLAIRPYNGDRPRIRTALVLNGQHWQADLELVPPHSLSAPLVLGTLAYGPRFLLDFQAEALAGPPMSWPEPFDPDATKS
ncbi:MAG: hypothetical protein KDD47_24095, partial [Acidobacteria bacterium]|nr:hypothetical protein [Acidobacteriota bacterium]